MSKLSKQEQKRAKRREKKNFRQAMEKELREHKSSFVVFYTLRLLVIVIFVRQIIIGTEPLIMGNSLKLLVFFMLPSGNFTI